ncbi:class II aldolase/adducin family protein, partial [Klebsiella pneumoniae]|uniref:class II aldolase/adducin family protein n=1 Tax=Klebsiella pneumoniae TaxID=573 RepID=UPI004055508B
NLLATPTGACLGELQAQRLSVVTLQGEWISGDKPSKEVTFHRAVYLHNPACKAIVHLHSHYGVLGIFRPKTTKCSGGPAVCGLQRG